MRKMLLRTFLFCVASFLSVMEAQSQDYGKMSSHLRRMVHERLLETSATRSRDGGQKNLPMVMLVRGEEEVLAPYCLSHQGDLHLCSLTIDEAIALSADKGVKRIQATQSDVTTCLDTLTKIVNVDNIWQGLNLPQAYTGKGVLVGVPDAGLEYSHPAFRDGKDGHLRIVRAWDKLDLSGGAVYDSLSCFPMGRLLCDPEAILAKAQSSDSKYLSHATFTTSTAAGSSAGSPYQGIAYEADIYSTTELVTNNKNMVDPKFRGYYTDELMLLTMSNIFAYADSVGQPCVISYSLGSAQDMTDVDIMQNQFLERLLTPGHVLVASAGNAGDEYHYIKKPRGKEYEGGILSSSQELSTINVSTTGPLVMRLTQVDSNHQAHMYDIPLDMTIGDTVSASGLKWYDFSDPDSLSSHFKEMTVQIYSGYDGFDSTRVGYDIFFVYSDVKPTANDMVVQFIGKDAEADIFIQNGQLIPGTLTLDDETIDMRDHPKGLGSLLSPGALPVAITVGATSHRTGWKRYDGVSQSYGGAKPHGDRAYFSSCGPTLHRFVKPDVMAPGMAVASALNSVYYEDHKTSMNDRVTYKSAFDGGKEYLWAIDSGTSLSTPVVAGIIALWLQADPTLTNDRIKEIFAKTCRQDESMLNLRLTDSQRETYGHGNHWPNNECGYGEIDAYKGLLEVLGLSSSIPTLSTRQLSQVKVLPDGTGNLTLSFETPLEKAVSCSVYTVSGQLLDCSSLSAGEQRITLQLSGYTGVIAVQVEGMGSTLVRL